MKRLSAIVSVLLVASVGLAQLARLAEDESIDAQISKVDELFEEWDKPDSPGCALAAIKDGKIIYKRGYGMADLEHDIPITSETVFYIGSVSKQFVTLSILLLAEQGRLSIDDDIRKYLPEFPNYGRLITIRHLIHHTSGIRDYLTLWSLSGKSYFDYMPVEAVLELIYSQEELNFEPGEQHLYSNSCYFLLAEIVRAASGKTLREFAEANIFGPLGMKNSHFHDNNKHIIRNRAFGYSKNADREFENMIMRFDLVGSGGLYTTVDDLFLWDQNFYNNKLGKGGQKLIETMLTNGALNNGEKVNYAFALVNGNHNGLRTVSHGGSLGGYRAQLVRFPDQRFSVAILSNLAGFNPTRLAYQVADVFLVDQFAPEKGKAKSSEPQSNSAKRTAIPVDPAVYDAYVGRYMQERGFVIAIAKENEKLILNWPGLPKMELLPESETRFFQNYDDDVISFERNQAGEISKLKVLRGDREIPYQRVLNLTRKKLAQYVGDYYSDELKTTYRLFAEDDLLFVQVGHLSKVQLVSSQRDVFVAAGNKAVFQRTDQGKVIGFTLDAGRVKNMKFRKK